MFDFFNSIGKYVGIAADFLFGEDRALGGTESKDRGLAGTLADSFLTTQGTASERRQEEQIRMKVPQLETGARARVTGTPQGQTFVGSRNQQLQSALRRLQSGAVRNPQYANIFPQRTLRQGRGTPRTAVGSSSLKGVTPTPAASVRKDIKVV
jgi:hypothetical protein